jgi:hypothetical protein
MRWCEDARQFKRVSLPQNYTILNTKSDPFAQMTCGPFLINSPQSPLRGMIAMRTVDNAVATPCRARPHE